MKYVETTEHILDDKVIKHVFSIIRKTADKDLPYHYFHMMTGVSVEVIRKIIKMLIQYELITRTCTWGVEGTKLARYTYTATKEQEAKLNEVLSSSK